MPGFYLPSAEEFDPETDDFVLHFLAKERQYRHFDLPLSDEDRIQQVDFSSEDAPHRFLPLLGYTDITRKFVRNANGERQEKIKERPIRFAGPGVCEWNAGRPMARSQSNPPRLPVALRRSNVRAHEPAHSRRARQCTASPWIAVRGCDQLLTTPNRT